MSRSGKRSKAKVSQRNETLSWRMKRVENMLEQTKEKEKEKEKEDQNVNRRNP